MAVRLYMVPQSLRLQSWLCAFIWYRNRSASIWYRNRTAFNMQFYMVP
eukprot:SAG11_NODE_34823_length_270_cov_0.555556_2_plen_48_part_01